MLPHELKFRIKDRAFRVVNGEKKFGVITKINISQINPMCRIEFDDGTMGDFREDELCRADDWASSVQL